MKIILYIAFIISVLTYYLWCFLPKGTYYIGNAIFIFLIILYIYLKNRKSTICFVLFFASLNNLLDELFFEPQKIGLNEYLILIVVIFLFIKNARKRP